MKTFTKTTSVNSVGGCVAKLLSLRFIITVLVTSLVLVCSTGILTTLMISQKVVLDGMLLEVTNQVQNSVSRTVTSFFDGPVHHLQQLTEMWRTGFLKVNDKTTMYRVIFPIMKTNAVYNNVAFSFENGLFAGYTRVNASDYWQISETLLINNGTTRALARFNIDDLGDPDYSHPMSAVPFINTVRPYYVNAKTMMGLSWTDFYISAKPFQGNIAVAIPVLNYTDPNRPFIGISSISYATFTISQAMEAIKVGQKGIAYLFDYNKNLIATNNPTIENFILSADGNKASPVYVLNSTNSIIAATSKYVLDHKIQDTKFTVRLLDNDLLISVSTIQTQGAKPITFTLVIVMFVSDFNEAITKSTVISLVISISLIIASIVLGIITSLLVTKSLNKLSNLMMQAATMNIDNMDVSKLSLSIIMEIRKIQQVFVHMVENLKEYKAFLPDNVLDNGKDDDDHERSEPKKVLQQSTSGGAHQYRRNSTASSSFYNSIVPVNKNSKFDLGLQSKEITIMTVKLLNFDEIAYQRSLSEVVDIHGLFIAEASAAIQRTRGVAQKFNANYITASWNAVRPCKESAVKACQAALSMKKLFADLSDKRTMNGNIPLKVAISVCSGPAFCGNLGTENIRGFSVVGQVTERSRMMVELTDMHPECALFIDDKTKSLVKDEFLVKPADSIRYFSQGLAPKPSAIDVDVFDTYEVVATKSKQGEEWMYEMEEKQKISCWDDLQESFALYKRGQINEAKEKLAVWVKHHPDVPCILKDSLENFQGKTFLDIFRYKSVQ